MSSWENTYDEPNEPSSRKELIKNQLLREHEQRNDAFSRPMEYIFEDVTGEKMSISLIMALPNDIYEDAKGHAEACLVTALKIKNINPKSIVNWIQSIVLCFNPILKFYIEDKLEEDVILSPYMVTPNNSIVFGLDRSFFYHLQLKHQSNEYREKTGTYFNNLYEILNQNKHRLKIDKDGKPRFKKLNDWHNKKTTADYARIALINFDKTFYQDFEECRM